MTERDPYGAHPLPLAPSPLEGFFSFLPHFGPLCSRSRTPVFTISRVNLSTAWSAELLRVESTWKNKPALLGLLSLLLVLTVTSS